MYIRIACSLSAAVLISGSIVAAQDDEFDVEEAPISLVGCVQREVDYRRQNNSGKGGFLGFGGGLGDEYVLVNASDGVSAPPGDCTTATGGEAYELTGSAEDDLEAFVGQRVEISGIRKEAEVDAATGRPTGGRQAGDDLKLFEVDVESFRAFAPPVQTDIIARADEPPLQLDQVDSDREAGVRTRRSDQTATFDNDQLPRTASPLAMTGLLGLLALGGVTGVRALYRRDRRYFR
jgi:hypothetical protein